MNKRIIEVKKENGQIFVKWENGETFEIISDKEAIYYLIYLLGGNE